MSEKFPFEDSGDQQFDNLRLPDEDQSWQKMKALLDEEDERRRPAFFLFKWPGLGLLFVGLMAGAYFLFFNNNTAEKKMNDIEFETSHQNQPKQEMVKPSPGNNNAESGHSLPPTSNAEKSSQQIEEGEQNLQVADKSVISTAPESSFKNQYTSHSAAKSKRIKPSAGNKAAFNDTSGELNTASVKNEQLEKRAAELTRAEKKAGEIKNDKIEIKDSILTAGEPTHPDSTAGSGKIKPVTLTPQMDSTKKKTQAGKKLFFSAGLGLQQQIPIGGQESVPYDSYGRKVSIADYIPSAFFRMHYEDKWFLMGEFRYGAPQQINDFNYAQKSEYDSSTMVLATTTMRLKKTYYHQLPLSFNYYVKPGWSLGLGAMYSRFYGAVTEKETRNYNVYTQDISYTKSINNVRGFTDSFLHKSQFHFIINTDYQYKNFMLGFRFTKDLQPYIKYARPDGIINEEKNYSLQAILRWQIWRKL